MTDEQLRAAARRVLHLVAFIDKDGECYWGMDTAVDKVEVVEAEAVAIMREEMDREWMAANHLDDDPTQSFVATT